MKNLFLLLIVVTTLFGCGDEEERVCHVPPPFFAIVVKNTEMDDNDLFGKSDNFFKPSAILHKMVNNEKKEIKRLFVSEEGNILISEQEESVKNFFTGSLETFYVEYGSRVDTLQLKGSYEDTDCGDVAKMLEIHFNGNQIDLSQSLLRHIGADFYKIDNTN